MSNLEVWSPGHGLALNGNLLVGAGKLASSLIWIPAFVTTQAAWVTGTSYTASTDLKCGSQVTNSSATYVCITAGGSTSTVAPGGTTTTQGQFTGVLGDGYNWLCIGNSTADFTSLALNNQAVSQMPFDNRASISAGDPYIQWSITIAMGATNGSVSSYVSILAQNLNQDGSTYGDGLAAGANLSAAVNQISANLPYPAGKTTPIVGTSKLLPADPSVFRGCIQNSAAAFSASTHVVAIRSGVLTTNG